MERTLKMVFKFVKMFDTWSVAQIPTHLSGRRDYATHPESQLTPTASIPIVVLSGVELTAATNQVLSQCKERRF